MCLADVAGLAGQRPDVGAAAGRTQHRAAFSGADHRMAAVPVSPVRPGSGPALRSRPANAAVQKSVSEAAFRPLHVCPGSGWASLVHGPGNVWFTLPGPSACPAGAVVVGENGADRAGGALGCQPSAPACG